jgi:hypothetical protein
MNKLLAIALALVLTPAAASEHWIDIGKEQYVDANSIVTEEGTVEFKIWDSEEDSTFDVIVECGIPWFTAILEDGTKFSSNAKDSSTIGQLRLRLCIPDAKSVEQEINT